MTTYDESNVFARILRGEIPNKTIYEDAHVLAFHDAFPKRAVHALVIPKGAYTDLSDFTARASNDEVLAYMRAMQQVVERLDLQENGYRVIANTGTDGGQEVPHFHMHILGGEPVGDMVMSITESPASTPSKQPENEQGGAIGPEPTRYGDWQHNGRVSDF